MKYGNWGTGVADAKISVAITGRVQPFTAGTTAVRYVWCCAVYLAVMQIPYAASTRKKRKAAMQRGAKGKHWYTHRSVYRFFGIMCNKKDNKWHSE